MSPEVHILLVEDSATQAELFREALKDSGVPHTLHTSVDGEDALEYLYASEVKPHLVVLDLNLPRKDGLEVLEEMKADPFLGVIPVIIMTSSTSSDDVRRAYAKQCNAYVQKPIGFDGFTSFASKLSGFWFDLAVLPDGPPEVRASTPPPEE